MRAELADVARRLPAAHLTPSATVQLADSLITLAERHRDVRFIDELHAAMRPLERRLATDLVTLFARLGQHVARAADEVGGLLVEAADPTGNERERVQAILTASGLDDWRAQRLRPGFEGHYLRTAQQVVETINAQLGLGVMLPDPVASKVVREGGRRAGLVDLTADTRRALFNVIAQAREEGLGPIEIARRIRSEVPSGRFVNAGPRYRAELISRTETMHAQRFSSLEVYRGADTISGVRLHDARLGDTDAECEARDGREVTFDDGEAEMFSPTTHPSCTLSFSPIVRAATPRT